MSDSSRADYSVLDRPEILRFIFHPRPEWRLPGTGSSAQDVLIPVEQDIVVGARFHMTSKTAPSVLFFHGNGEIVADYDDLAPVYNRMGINFMPVDYRGYGRSTGTPTVAAMMQDCHKVFEHAKAWLAQKGYSGAFIVMGRSLGSASVLDLAAQRQDAIDGLIVESGFAYAGPLLQLLGINAGALGFTEDKGFRNVDKVRMFPKPTLIIHAEHDHIIPFTDAQALYDASSASDKTLIKIPGANHNDIFARGLPQYMSAIKTFTDKLHTPSNP